MKTDCLAIQPACGREEIEEIKVMEKREGQRRQGRLRMKVAQRRMRIGVAEGGRKTGEAGGRHGRQRAMQGP